MDDLVFDPAGEEIVPHHIAVDYEDGRVGIHDWNSGGGEI